MGEAILARASGGGGGKIFHGSFASTGIWAASMTVEDIGFTPKGIFLTNNFYNTSYSFVRSFWYDSESPETAWLSRTNTNGSDSGCCVLNEQQTAYYKLTVTISDDSITISSPQANPTGFFLTYYYTIWG